MASNRKSAARHHQGCQDQTADQRDTHTPYRCVFLTEAQSSSAGMLSSEPRDQADAQKRSPGSCNPTRALSGMRYCLRVLSKPDGHAFSVSVSKTIRTLAVRKILPHPSKMACSPQ